MSLNPNIISTWQPQYWGRKISRHLKFTRTNHCQAPEYYIAGFTILYVGS